MSIHDVSRSIPGSPPGEGRGKRHMEIRPEQEETRGVSGPVVGTPSER